MKALTSALIILIIAMIIGAALIINGGVTGYSIVPLCPQPSWVYINKPLLNQVNESVTQEVNDFFNLTAESIRSFNKDASTYYLASFINGGVISDCVTDLSVVCGCQIISFS